MKRSMAKAIKYVIITPVRDEAPYIEKTIGSVIAQTIRPFQWVIVDDGSSDGTSDIVDRHAARASWIDVVHRKNRGFRAAGGGVVEAFYAGYSLVNDSTWDFLIKLDGDLSFVPDYFERCFQLFDADPKLGIGGGLICRHEGGELEVDSRGDPPFHVRGATKIYRRDCWETISPLIRAPGWDTVDEIKANMSGWTTRTFDDPRLIQLKPTGAADGCWRDSYKNGRANYIAGYHPLFMLAKSIKRIASRPPLLQSTALLAGYCSGYLRGMPRMLDQETVRYL